jgi:citrate synthase
MDLYISASEAAEILGVSVQTLYTYVSRKGIRSQKVSGSRERRYWAPDIERIRSKERPDAGAPRGGRQETDITLLTPDGPFYRGESALRLSKTQTLEEVAAHLWQVEVNAAFGGPLPAAPTEFADLAKMHVDASSTDKAIALLPFLEQANPTAYDLSREGMVRTGADVLRLYAAILTDQSAPSAAPLHLQVAQYLKANDDVADLIRQLLVLSADHGFRAGAYAVRAVASTGVSPYRSVLAGFAITNGRRTQFGRVEGIRRLLAEICESRDPRSAIVARLQEGDALPGFDTLAPYAQSGDPRARHMLDSLERVFGENEVFLKTADAIAFVEDRMRLKPSFALANTLFSELIGLPRQKVLYILGRCAGWVAHSIEQYESGPIEPRVISYRGSLPKPDRGAKSNRGYEIA